MQSSEMMPVLSGRRHFRSNNPNPNAMKFKRKIPWLEAALVMSILIALAFVFGFGASAGDAKAPIKLLRWQMTEPVDGKYNIRYIAGVNSLDFKATGFEIEEKSSGKKWCGESSYVYLSLSAKPESISAMDLEVGYLTAAVLKGLPTGSLEFKITPYVVTFEGERIYGDSVIHKTSS